MFYKLQLYKWLWWSFRAQSQSLSSCLQDGPGLCRSEVSFHEEETLLFPPLHSEDKQDEVSWLFKLTHATVTEQRWQGVVQRSADVGQVTPSCGDSCGRSWRRRLRTGTGGRRRSTRCAPLCGGRGWCGSAGRPGLTTPWGGSSAGRGCRSWSTPVCWPSEGSHVHTATEKSRNTLVWNLSSLFYSHHLKK